jgi:stage II sporulation protein Q
MNKALKVLLPTIYISVIGVMFICVLLILSGIKGYLKEDVNYNYALDNVFTEEVIPVSRVGSDVIVKPFISSYVNIYKKYYDYESDNQEDSIIYYKGTYFQNNGIDYESSDNFEVVSILDGEVISIEDSDIYGKILKIKHNDNLVSVYYNIKDILVNVGYKTTTGEIIASSNKSIYENDEKSLLHFEIYYNNKSINPESVYSLNANSLE